MTDKKCKICRRAGEKLFLKGERCFTPKCGFTARPYAPGRLDSERKHRSQLSEYGSQMKEKQKIRNIYGVSEKQFSNYIKASTKSTGDNKTAPSLQLYRNLETRLDNVVYRIGFAKSRALARQVVSHGHILVNGKRLDVASHKVKIGDVIEIRNGSLVTKLFTDMTIKNKDVSAPNWIEYDKAKVSAKIVGAPNEVEDGFDLAKVLEFYSK